MLKNISKLSLLLFVFALSIVSCSDSELNEETQNINVETNYQAKAAPVPVYNCPLENQNRITHDNRTYGSWSNNNGLNCLINSGNYKGCFPNKLKNVINAEFLKGSGVNTTQTNYTNQISSVHLYEIEDLPNINLYPSISPQYSNKLYRYIACEIQNHLGGLPTLPVNQYYFPRATYVSMDFTFSGPEWNNSLINFYYDVEIKTH